MAVRKTANTTETVEAKDEQPSVAPQPVTPPKNDKELKAQRKMEILNNTATRRRQIELELNAKKMELNQVETQAASLKSRVYELQQLLENCDLIQTATKKVFD